MSTWRRRQDLGFGTNCGKLFHVEAKGEAPIEFKVSAQPTMNRYLLPGYLLFLFCRFNEQASLNENNRISAQPIDYESFSPDKSTSKRGSILMKMMMQVTAKILRTEPARMKLAKSKKGTPTREEKVTAHIS